jgi:hypothetical protein
LFVAAATLISCLGSRQQSFHLGIEFADPHVG